MYRNGRNDHYTPSSFSSSTRAPWADDIDEIRGLLRQILNQRPPTNYDTDFPPLNLQQQQQQPQQQQQQQHQQQQQQHQQQQQRQQRQYQQQQQQQQPTRPIPLSNLNIHTPPGFRNGPLLPNPRPLLPNPRPTLSRPDRLTTNDRRDQHQVLNHNNNNQQQRPSRLQDRLFRYVQIGHHLRNWDRLPKQLDSRLQDLVADIKPPLSNPTLINTLNRSTLNFTNCITLKVREHLLFQKGEIENDLRGLNVTPEMLNDAAATVVQILRQRFSKITPLHHNLLNNAKSIVGVAVNSRTDVLNVDMTDSINVATNTHAVEVVAPTPPLAVRSETGNSADRAADEAAGERGDDDPTIIYNLPVNNIFAVLAQTTDNTHSPLKRKRVITPPSTSPPNNLETAPKRLLPQPPSPVRPHGARELPKPTTVNSTITHTTISNEPRVTAVSDRVNVTLNFNSNVKTLIIGSSNFTRVPEHSLPKDWHIIAFPGATIQYITNIIDELPILMELENIVISCGLNNRHDVNEPPILECLRACNRLQVTIFFNGISFQKSLLTEKECTTLNRINELAIGYRNTVFIGPLNDSETVMRFQSPIHYDESTLAKIVDRIISGVTKDFY
jgi:hypothetical protein